MPACILFLFPTFLPGITAECNPKKLFSPICECPAIQQFGEKILLSAILLSCPIATLEFKKLKSPIFVLGPTKQ